MVVAGMTTGQFTKNTQPSGLGSQVLIHYLGDDGGGCGADRKGVNSRQNLEAESAGSDYIFPPHLWQNLDKWTSTGGDFVSRGHLSGESGRQVTTTRSGTQPQMLFNTLYCARHPWDRLFCSKKVIS